VQGREPVGPIRLASDLDRLLRFVRATCRRDGISVTFEASGDPVIQARGAEVEHILLNLLHNAARALRQGEHPRRKITVRARRAEGGVDLEVEDTGGGVPEELEGRLFTPLGAGPAGTGVGLYLARSLAERNGAQLCYTRTGEGSLFRLSFPDAS